MGRAGTHSPQPIVLDTGALIALERSNERVLALLDKAQSAGRKFLIPAGVVAQAWRNGQLQVLLARFLRGDNIEIIPLDDRAARLCGEYCAITRTTDIIDASVVVLAKERRASIVSSDPEDLRRLNPAAHIITI